MRKTMLTAFLLLAGIALISGNAFAAWTQAKGHMYNQLSISYYTSDSKYSTLDEDENNLIPDNSTVDNHKIENPKFTSTNLTYYGAYGITDKVTVSLTVPYKWVTSDDVEQYTEERGPKGIGDIDVGVRYNLSQNILGTGALMSVDGKVKIPAAYDCEHPMGYQNLGDCQYDAQVSLVFGRGFNWGYAILDLGYKYRFENTEFGQFKPADQFKMRIDAGHGLTSKLSLRGNFDWTQSLDNSQVSDDFVESSAPYGFDAGWGKQKIKKDSLGLEPKSLSVGVALAYSISSQIQAVVGFDTTVKGFWVFETEDAGIGQTYTAAAVYMF